MWIISPDDVLLEAVAEYNPELEYVGLKYGWIPLTVVTLHWNEGLF